MGKAGQGIRCQARLAPEVEKREKASLIAIHLSSVHVAAELSNDVDFRRPRRQVVSLPIKSPKDFWTEILFLIFGAIAFAISRDYPFGSAGRMGPGYFPTVLSCLLMGFGGLAVLRGVRQQGVAFGSFAWKQSVKVLSAIIAFAFLLPRAGLVIALLVLIFGSASASIHFRFGWRATLLALVLLVFCVLVFVKGLGLPMPLLGIWFGA